MLPRTTSANSTRWSRSLVITETTMLRSMFVYWWTQVPKAEHSAHLVGEFWSDDSFGLQQQKAFAARDWDPQLFDPNQVVRQVDRTVARSDHI